MARQLCSNCQFPQSQCVCDAVQSVATETQLIVLQHPSEVQHSKNTVRLLPLTLATVQVVIGETPEDFQSIRTQLEQATRPVYLLYPSEHSVEPTTAHAALPSILVVLDGTWRKAHKMLMLNPWLLELTHLRLPLQQPSQYRIRKAKRDDSLSSLEAAAYGIKALEPSVNIEPLLGLFHTMIEKRLSAMPADVRQRY